MSGGAGSAGPGRPLPKLPHALSGVVRRSRSHQPHTGIHWYRRSQRLECLAGIAPRIGTEPDDVSVNGVAVDIGLVGRLPNVDRVEADDLHRLLAVWPWAGGATEIPVHRLADDRDGGDPRRVALHLVPAVKRMAGIAMVGCLRLATRSEQTTVPPPALIVRDCRQGLEPITKDLLDTVAVEVTTLDAVGADGLLEARPLTFLPGADHLAGLSLEDVARIHADEETSQRPISVVRIKCIPVAMVLEEVPLEAVGHLFLEVLRTTTRVDRSTVAVVLVEAVESPTIPGTAQGSSGKDPGAGANLLLFAGGFLDNRDRVPTDCTTERRQAHHGHPDVHLVVGPVVSGVDEDVASVRSRIGGRGQRHAERGTCHLGPVGLDILDGHIDRR